jgi:glycosyltransferase involved in cell wall biosynthesis
MVHPHDLYSAFEPWTVRIKNIAYQFKEKGHTVKLAYFPLDSREAYREFTVEGIEIIALDRRLGFFRGLRNIKKMIELGKWSQVIHFQKCYYYSALPALISSWVNNKPVHYDWDDCEAKIFYYSNPRQFIIGEFLNIFEILIPKAVDTISVSSDYLRNICLSRGVSGRDIFPAHVGADLGHFSPDSSLSGEIKKKYGIPGELILYVGQLHGGQYAELFIKAAAGIIKENRWDVRFMIIGDGYRLAELKGLAAGLGVSGRFIFTGFIPHDRIPAYVNAADICVACFEENDITRCKSPLKIAEYLACGKAIVASNVGEVRRMVGGVGILAKPGDTDSLSSGIRSLLSDKALRARLGGYARKRAETEYNWEVTAENILRAYKGIIPNYYVKGVDDNGGKKMEKPVRDKKTGQGLSILSARVISVSSHKDAPWTVEIKIKKFIGEAFGSLTIDPRCTIYKDDKNPKTVDVIKPGSIIEATYLVHEGVKVAFNIIVQPDNLSML